MELDHCEAVNVRPHTFAEIEKLFPAAIVAEVWSTARNRAKPKASTEPPPPVQLPSMFTDVGIDVTYMRDTMKQFKRTVDARKSISASKDLQRPLRTEDSIAARVAAVSSCKWPTASSNFGRDLAFFYKIGLLEQYLVEKYQYRQALLPTALGQVRLSLHTILDTCVEKRTISLQGQTAEVSTWLFIDQLVPPPNAKAGAVNHADYLADAQEKAATDANVTWLKALRNKVENYPHSWVLPEDGEETGDRSVDEDVSIHLTRLLRAIYLSQQRNSMRQRLGDSTATFVIEDNMPPDDIYPIRDTFCDSHTTFPVSYLSVSFTQSTF